MSELSVTVDDAATGGMRLDRYCARMTGSPTRSRLKNGAKSVSVNGKPAKLSRQVFPGDRIDIVWEDEACHDIAGENIPLEVVYEDDNVTVVNKAQGTVTHPAAGNWTGTLVNALLWRWSATVPAGSLRPGIVHRLDKDTSGIIITARNPETESWLQGQFKRRRTKKVYAAILSGVPPTMSGSIRTRIARDPKNRKRFTWTDNDGRGKDARTDYRVVKTYGPYALVLFRLYTGRTHQIRVHCKYLGCPILGDPVYGKKDRSFPDATLMLHAKTLVITLPGNERASRFDAPIPIRFRKVIRALKRLYPR
jgi:23S rRNA pseudouridine1911/1915/1917 synthase